MITVTEAASKQIAVSREQGNAQDLALRIAIQAKPDGSFHYLMGFDDQIKPGDVKVESDNVVIDEATKPLANGMTLDYVDIEGTFEFVFLNPNDPSYQPPQV